MYLVCKDLLFSPLNIFANLQEVFRFHLTLVVLEIKKNELANNVDLDEVAHNELPHLDLHCLPSSL